MENDAKQFDKLKADPVESEILVNGNPVKVWIHALSDSQNVHCLSVFREQYDLLTSDGQDEKYASSMAYLAMDIQLIKYSVKRGQLRADKGLFENGREILALPFDARNAILKTYSQSFDFTEAELGESLRARMGISTPSTISPATSQVN